MDLHSQSFYIVGAVGSSCKVRKVKLNLIPTLVQTHRHGAYERFNPSGRLIIASAEPAPDIFIIQNLFNTIDIIISKDN